jgi:hypothetical protein
MFVDRLVTAASTSSRCVALFRGALGALVALEVADRWSVLEWMYSDAGSLPRHAVLPNPVGEGRLVWAACLHSWDGSVRWVQILAILELLCAAALACGVRPVASSIGAWWLHCSLGLRNASLVYILDRYLHLLLLISACLPTSTEHRHRLRGTGHATSTASLFLMCQLMLIYSDSGLGKALDPARALSLTAPVAALDTYMRHTPTARALHRLLGGHGVRAAGAATVCIELFAAPVAFACASPACRRVAIVVICSLHVGIALCMRNTLLLSAAAIIAWIPFLDVAPPSPPPEPAEEGPADRPAIRRQWVPTPFASAALSVFAILCAHHQYTGGDGAGCDGRTGPDGLRTTLLYQRWNVFASAESYVVWEIAPARLSDGSVVDVWRDDEKIAWAPPMGSEPSRRRGRWRAWPYTASREADGPSDVAFWSALCDEWERFDPHGRTIDGFHFYMMQADTVPIEDQANRGVEYGQVRKRLIRRFRCAQRQAARAALQLL